MGRKRKAGPRPEQAEAAADVDGGIRDGVELLSEAARTRKRPRRGSPPHWLTEAAQAGGEPAEHARVTLRALVTGAEGNLLLASERMGMARVTLERVIVRLGLETEVEEIRHRVRLAAIEKKSE